MRNLKRHIRTLIGGSAMLLFCIVVTAYCFMSVSVSGSFRTAGDNKCELERVLEHYKKEDKDRRKLEAARFLIKNMPLHKSIDPEHYKVYCDTLTAVFRTMPNDSAVIIANEISSLFAGKLALVRDIDIVSSEYLIKNIDQAFDMWENSPFLAHIDFDEFCEFVLPYKCFEFQPLDNWREYAKFPPGNDLEVMSSVADYRSLPRSAAEVVSGMFEEEIAGKPSVMNELNKIYAYDYNLMRALPFGTCQEYASIDVIAERANGVPVCTDFTPNWPFRQCSHYWSVVRNRSRRDINYMALERRPGDSHYEDFRHAKVFRRTYAPNKELVKMMRKGERLPQVFAAYPFIKDVTEEYSYTHDLRVKLLPRFRLNRYAYLAVFDCFTWKVVDFGKVCLGRAYFDKVGFDSMYLVMVTDSDGNLIPASKPFAFSYDGTVSYVEADPEGQTHSVTLTRKYPATWHIWNLQKQIRGGAVDAADMEDLSDAREIGVFPDGNLFSDEIAVTDSLSHRYWRLRATKVECTYFAEIYFYRNGERIKPKVHSYTAGLNPYLSSLLIDDVITICPLIAKDGYVAFDFGEPVRLDKISIVKRGDLNDVTPGDEYALYAWVDSGWELIGQKVADDISITFDNVPCGALLYIKGLSTGVQNRIFLYESGHPVWF